MATGALTVGPKPPEVTMPIIAPSARGSPRRRAPARGPAGRMPTRLRCGPSASSRRMRSAPGKPPAVAPRLGDGEGEVRLDRRGRLVEVVAVERQPGFEPQRIARAEPDRLHLRLGEQRPRDRLRVLGGDGNLESVLAGIAGARDGAVDAVEFGAGRAHEDERSPPSGSAAPCTFAASGPCRASSARSSAVCSVTPSGRRSRT